MSGAPVHASAPRVGRPPARIDPAELQALVSRGATLKQAARALGVSQRTMQAHLARRPELRAAEIAGRRRSARVEIAESKLDQLCEQGYWPAIRLRIFRNLGWFQAGLDIGMVSPRLGAEMRTTYERLGNLQQENPLA
jgi:DNA-binding transcriptional ArsR family regulator